MVKARMQLQRVVGATGKVRGERMGSAVAVTGGPGEGECGYWRAGQQVVVIDSSGRCVSTFCVGRVGLMPGLLVRPAAGCPKGLARAKQPFQVRGAVACSRAADSSP